MLIKEYRIPMPFTVDEYRVAQLYMIQKKSREESSGEGSGVEIMKNEPYKDGPGGKGQYTYKIYHIGSHLPNWFRAILPKSALRVEEEAWNAYPYTKTVLKCPFIEKFSITIETVYHQDSGTQENVFNLSQAQLRSRTVDVLDFVKDPVSAGDYKKEEDPKLYVSAATGRGPLTHEWVKERTVKGVHSAPIMCAYKLCYVEFKYWGMQTKIERFIHDTALRKTMVRAHRQVWAWQDEWMELSIDDIRKLEAETQKALAEKMDFSGDQSSTSEVSQAIGEIENLAAADGMSVVSENDKQPSVDSVQQKRVQWREYHSISSKTLTGSPPGSRLSWCSLERIKDDSDDDDEFFDAHDEFDEIVNHLDTEMALQQPSSFEDLSAHDEFSSTSPNSSSCGSPTKQTFLHSPSFMDEMDGTSCNISVLFIVLHGGNALLVESDKNAKLSDLSTWRLTFDKVVSRHYPNFLHRYSIKLVPCPAIHSDSLNMLASINPYCQGSDSGSHLHNDYFPISAVPLLAFQSADYQDGLKTVSNRANKAYRDFLLSDEGQGFNGQVILIGDCMGSVMAFDIICSLQNDLSCSTSESLNDKKKFASDTDLSNSTDSHDPLDFSASMPSSRLSKLVSTNGLQSPASSAHLNQHDQRPDVIRFDFDVGDFFMLGSPLALVLVSRNIINGTDVQPRPSCFQIYNLFYPTDPCAGRLEALLESSFNQIDTVKVPRYQYFPLGDGQSTSLFDCLKRYGMFSDGYGSPRAASLMRQGSNASYLSTASVDLNLESVSSVARKWWGNKRLDYAMYCPDALTHFPTNALPHLFHASFWESLDAVSFILRQILAHDGVTTADLPSGSTAESQLFQPYQPREKWLNRRTALKTKNIASNHRGNDVLVTEDKPQRISARFMYGPLDLVTLSNEKVDLHIVRDLNSKQWDYMGTSITDKYGRITFQIPIENRLPQGLYPVKMVVRGDHTFTDISLLVLPPNTNVVLFSIDGSFTASVSIMGKDPKVRPGAVDVVRYWQDRGYCILYISARPDMQLGKVRTWLAQHNFPHGMLAFMDGVSAEPMKQKAQYLKSLVKESSIDIVAAYGAYKDIAVYQSLNLDSKRIYVVGKVHKKAHAISQVLEEGYATHLKNLQLTSEIRPATGNARLFLQKSSFLLPGQKYKKSASKVQQRSNPLCSGDIIPAITIDRSGNTSIDPGAAGGGGNSSKVRGRSPRLVALQKLTEDSMSNSAS
ncbi:protein retinal degeneration B-like [Watersipora subatra]|uniref:protein retinal degeneration B-like n=1 Tax=Watersipora subatra TaxID=2589382 RepID=UPI00355AD8A3